MVFTDSRKRGKENQTVDLLTDRPVSFDYLNFSPLVNALAGTISDVEMRRELSIVGIFGERGSGKTSFLRILEHRLQENDIHPIWFRNAWKYSQEDHLWSALIQMVLKQTDEPRRSRLRIWVKLRIWLFFKLNLKRGTWEVTKNLLALLARGSIIFLCIVAGINSQAIANTLNTWLAAHAIIPTNVSSVLVSILVIAIGIIAADPTKLWDLFKGDIRLDFSKFERKFRFPDHIAFLDEFSEEFQKLIDILHPRKSPLVVMIDDLDHGLPGNALRVLEAMKVLENIDCVFLVGVDQRVVVTAIAAKYKDLYMADRELYGDGQSSTVNRSSPFLEDYLFTLVPITFLMPQLTGPQIKSFIQQLNRDEQGIVVDSDVERCAAIFGAALSTNPARIKSALRSFRFARDRIEEYILHGSIQRNDFQISLLAKLIVIRLQFASLYNVVISQPSLLGELEASYRDFDNNRQSQVADSYAEKYHGLPNLLRQKIDTDDTFVNADIHVYISELIIV